MIEKPALRYLAEIGARSDQLKVWDPFAGDGSLADGIRLVYPDTYATDTEAKCPVKPGGKPVNLDFLRQAPNFKPDIIISVPPDPSAFVRRGLEFLEKKQTWVLGVLTLDNWDALPDNADIVNDPRFSVRQVIRGTTGAWYWFHRHNNKHPVNSYDSIAPQAV